jgi:hypothetical protein
MFAIKVGGGSGVVAKCDHAIEVLQQGGTRLDDIWWLSRRDFSDLICPVPLFLWMVAYDERYNVIVGAGLQGR